MVLWIYLESCGILDGDMPCGNLKVPLCVIHHGCPGVKYEKMGNYAVDRALLDFLIQNQTSDF